MFALITCTTSGLPLAMEVSHRSITTATASLLPSDVHMTESIKFSETGILAKRGRRKALSMALTWKDFARGQVRADQPWTIQAGNHREVKLSRNRTRQIDHPGAKGRAPCLSSSECLRSGERVLLSVCASILSIHFSQGCHSWSAQHLQQHIFSCDSVDPSGSHHREGDKFQPLYSQS